MEMESMLFSNVPAEKLNQQVREKIADHLFLICHYNPCSNVFAEDAKFIAGCLNLYKATVDSSCMIRRMEKNRLVLRRFLQGCRCSACLHGKDPDVTGRLGTRSG